MAFDHIYYIFLKKYDLLDIDNIVLLLYTRFFSSDPHILEFLWDEPNLVYAYSMLT